MAVRSNSSSFSISQLLSDAPRPKLPTPAIRSYSLHPLDSNILMTMSSSTSSTLAPSYPPMEKGNNNYRRNSIEFTSRQTNDLPLSKSGSDYHVPALVRALEQPSSPSSPSSSTSSPSEFQEAQVATNAIATSGLVNRYASSPEPSSPHFPGATDAKGSTISSISSASITSRSETNKFTTSAATATKKTTIPSHSNSAESSDISTNDSVEKVQEQATQAQDQLSSSISSTSSGSSFSMPEAILVKNSLTTTYQCPYKGCQKKYTRPYNLKSHYLSAHTNERPWKCSKCSMDFVRKNDFNRHSKLHENTKPHRCEICKKYFNRMDSLKRHVSICPSRQ